MLTGSGRARVYVRRWPPHDMRHVACMWPACGLHVACTWPAAEAERLLLLSWQAIGARRTRRSRCGLGWTYRDGLRNCRAEESIQCSAHQHRCGWQATQAGPRIRPLCGRAGATLPCHWQGAHDLGDTVTCRGHHITLHCGGCVATHRVVVLTLPPEGTHMGCREVVGCSSEVSRGMATAARRCVKRLLLQEGQKGPPSQQVVAPR